MELFITESTCACPVNGTLFLLSLKKNRYYSIQKSQAFYWQRDGAFLKIHTTNKLGEQLILQGLCTFSRCAQELWRDYSLKEELFLPEEISYNISLTHYWNCFNSLRKSAKMLSKVFLRELKICFGLKQNKQNHTVSIEKLVYVYRQLRPYYPRAFNCLFDSVALRCFLETYGIFTHCIIAVKDEPFEAHAWLQKDNVVLNDTLEKTSLFSPILRF